MYLWTHLVQHIQPIPSTSCSWATPEGWSQVSERCPEDTGLELIFNFLLFRGRVVGMHYNSTYPQVIDWSIVVNEDASTAVRWKICMKKEKQSHPTGVENVQFILYYLLIICTVPCKIPTGVPRWNKCAIYSCITSEKEYRISTPTHKSISCLCSIVTFNFWDGPTLSITKHTANVTQLHHEEKMHSS